jgi:hypothetical protein
VNRDFDARTGASLALERRHQRMIRIAITAAAFDAISSTLPLGSVAVEAKANERGKLVWTRPTLAAGTFNRCAACWRTVRR